MQLRTKAHGTHRSQSRSVLAKRHLARGDRVELRGFGAFRVRHRSARNGRNPQNGALVAVNQKNMPHFKPSKEMHERLNKAQG